MTTPNPSALVIVGSGLAAWTLAREVRKLDAQRPLVLVTRDDGGFYSKPVLSNALASGRSPQSLVTNAGAAAAEAIGATLLDHREAVAIDVGLQRLALDDRTVDYEQLVLAVGADPIRLPLAGAPEVIAQAVFSVNDLADYARFRAALPPRARVAVLGAGLIGCEFANDLILGGHQVAAVDPAPQPLGRLVPAPIGRALEDALTGAGVVFHLGTTAQSIERQGEAYELRLANGAVLTVDLVLSAVGLRPRTQLAGAAGLVVDRGIVVDETLQTSASAVYAVGDCAQVHGQVLPYVMPLMVGARALAKTLTGARTPVRYPVMPVVVKTPLLPVTVVAPAAASEAQWHAVANAEGLEFHCLDEHARLVGFALSGAACGRRAALVQRVGQPLA